MRAWERDELEEQIGQAAVLLIKLLITPEDCALRSVCEGWLQDHKAYIPEATGYDISLLDGDERNLGF